MDYEFFLKKLQQVDPRVKFKKMDQRLLDENLKIPAFYQVVNPIHVEFEFNDGIVKLEPFEGILSLKKAYPYVTGGCVFATCNGDPIYIKDGGVYTCVHGTKRIIEEKIAVSVEDWFEEVMNTL